MPRSAIPYLLHNERTSGDTPVRLDSSFWGANAIGTLASLIRRLQA